MKLRPVHVELSSKKTLIGTVGYHVLGNHSMPPMLFPHLQKLDLPKHIKVDELNWGPVAVVQMLEAENPSFERVIILCAIEREGRDIGEIDILKWAEACQMNNRFRLVLVMLQLVLFPLKIC